MTSKWRRYELLLPRRFNDGTAVPNAWLGEALNEIIERFGAVSFERHRLEGRWRFQTKVYRDISTRLIVDVADTSRNRKWLKSFQEKWRKRLKQIELRMVSYPIKVE